MLLSILYFSSILGKISAFACIHCTPKAGKRKESPVTRLTPSVSQPFHHPPRLDFRKSSAPQGYSPVPSPQELRPPQSCVPTGTTPSRRISPKPNTGIETFKSAARLPTVLPLKASAESVVCGYLYPTLTAIGVLGAQPLNVFFSPFFFSEKKEWVLQYNQSNLYKVSSRIGG